VPNNTCQHLVLKVDVVNTRNVDVVHCQQTEVNH